LIQNAGYTKADLYVTTWGQGNSMMASQTIHSRPNLEYNRAFVEAVLAYTKADQVILIGHSMGVSIGRKVVKGGKAYDSKTGGDYNLGAPLTDKVKLFIGLAGANEGLNSCKFAMGIPTCNKETGKIIS
jgi:triacylglycerol esterase/lipase EstA (alpha/beta hydrolase family)